MRKIGAVLLSLLVCGAASAKVNVTLQTGIVRSADSLTIKDGRFLLPPDSNPVLPAQVTAVEYVFDGFSIEQGRALLDHGDCAGIIARLADQQNALLATVSLPGNSAEWVSLLFRARYHSGDYAAARALPVAGLLLQTAPALYEVLALMDEGRKDEAARLLKTLSLPDTAAGDLIRAQLAAGRNDYKEALQHLGRLQAFHYRETEWLPAALFLEGLVYQKTGETEARDYTVRELETVYPSSSWCQRAKKQLK